MEALIRKTKLIAGLKSVYNMCNSLQESRTLFLMEGAGSNVFSIGLGKPHATQLKLSLLRKREVERESYMESRLIFI